MKPQIERINPDLIRVIRVLVVLIALLAQTVLGQLPVAKPETVSVSTERLAQMLQQAGAAVEMHWQPGGHALNQAEVRAAMDWLGRVQRGS